MKPMPTRSKLAELCDAAGPWVTILTPLEGGGPLAKGDPARYRNLVRSAAEQLAARTNGDGEAIVARLRELADDRSVFNTGAAGMVVFANRDRLQLWHLPEAVREGAFVDDRPHLEPLLPIVAQPSHFYVITLSLHGTRLFSCDRFEARPMPLPDRTPRRIEDAAGWEIEQDSLQYHNMRGTTGASGGPPVGHPAGHQGNRPIYHGQGGGEDDRGVDIEKYLRAIDQALWRSIPHHEAPVVLACDPQVEGIFRRVTRLPNVLEPALRGNFERADRATIHELAWERVAPLVERRVEEARQRFLHQNGTGKTAERVEDVVPLASQGRVDTLLVREGANLDGHFDEQEWTVRLDGDGPTTDLIDRAASDTYLNRGVVHVLRPEEMPSDSPLAAILRW